MKLRSILVIAAGMLTTTVTFHTTAFAKTSKDKPTTPPGHEKKKRPDKVCLPPTLTPALQAKKVRLGEIIFHDNRLSNPAGVSCAYCHSDGSGFNGNGDAGHAVFEGAVSGRFGTRNPPAASYATYSPPLTLTTSGYVGGQFWDGRAADLAAQAKGPFLNPVEMNNPDAKTVAKKVLESSYSGLYREVYGVCGIADGNAVFTNIADALAAYESSRGEVNRFTSRYDWYLKDQLNNPLNNQEKNGLALFQKNCASCHPLDPPQGVQGPLFTDFSYDNVGIPKNPEIPYYKAKPSYADLGLGKVVRQFSENGKFKVPTLRNVAIAPPYGHNGYFKTLKEIVNFYNTRDVPNLWPQPEVIDNLNRTEIGNMGLTSQDEDDIVAFLEALTDGALPRRK